MALKLLLSFQKTAIFMNVSGFGKAIPIVGAVCAVGIGILLYFVFSKNGKFD